MDEAEKIAKTAKAEGRDLTDSEVEKVSQCCAKAKSNQAEMDLLHDVVFEPCGDGRLGINPFQAHVPGGSGVRRQSGPRSFDTLFGPARSSGQFRGIGDFLAAVGNAPTHHDGRLALASTAFAANFEGTDSTGGFAVPVEYSREIISGALEKSLMLSKCDVRPMLQFNELKIPAFDDQDHSSGLLYGGIRATWSEEGGQPDLSTPLLRQLSLKARKLFILVQLSSELLADSPGMERELGKALSDAAAFFIDDVMIATGTGAGQPLSILNSPGVVSVAKDSGQLAETVTYTNLANMVGSLHPSCFADSIWICNPTVLPQLLSLVVKVKNEAGTENVGGSFVPVLTESSGQLKLLTRPCFLSEKCKALGTAGDIILFSPQQYVAGLRQEISIARSAHVGFLTHTVYFRMVCRVDGMSKWSSTVTMKNGGSVGWAVTLAERS